jgi:hypothetical protein
MSNSATPRCVSRGMITVIRNEINGSNWGASVDYD